MEVFVVDVLLRVLKQLAGVERIPYSIDNVYLKDLLWSASAAGMSVMKATSYEKWLGSSKLLLNACIQVEQQFVAVFQLGDAVVAIEQVR